jgi:hypothetical protein
MLLTGDGLQLFRDRNHETGFLEIHFLNFPPNVRSKKNQTFTYGVIEGPKGPKTLKEILIPFLEEFKILSTRGFMVEGVLRRAHLVVIAGDLKYLEKLDEKMSVGTYRVCRKCLIWGTRCADNTCTYYPITLDQKYQCLQFDIIESVSGASINRQEEDFKKSLVELEKQRIEISTDQLKIKQQNIGYKGFPLLFELPVMFDYVSNYNSLYLLPRVFA